VEDLQSNGMRRMRDRCRLSNRYQPEETTVK
jgi:hypothetical protein